MPLFTVFTPTYNRAHTIHRVYKSLINQTYRDFEWLVVDDGSTDNTRDLIEGWRHEADFAIRYVWQPNAHKKSAFNRGVQLAAGELFLTADSDDSFLPNALERFVWHWSKIPIEKRGNYVGVCGLCQDEQGNVVGDTFPGGEWLDSNSMELRHRYRVKGEKWGCSRVDVLRKHPFPENIPGHVPEGVVWMDIAKKYQTRFINEVVRIYFHDAGDQLTQTGNPANNSIGALYWKRSVLTTEIPWFLHNPKHFLLEAARWTRFRLHIPKEQAIGIDWWPAGFGGSLVVLMAPFGVVWWLFDKYKMANSNDGKFD